MIARIKISINLAMLSKSQPHSSYDLAGIERVLVEDYLPASSLISLSLNATLPEFNIKSFDSSCWPEAHYSFETHKVGPIIKIPPLAPNIWASFFPESLVVNSDTDYFSLFVSDLRKRLWDTISLVLQSYAFNNPLAILEAIQHWKSGDGIRRLKYLINSYVQSSPTQVKDLAFQREISAIRNSLPRELRTVAIAMDTHGEVLFPTDITGDYRFYELFHHQFKPLALN